MLDPLNTFVVQSTGQLLSVTTYTHWLSRIRMRTRLLNVPLLRLGRLLILTEQRSMLKSPSMQRLMLVRMLIALHLYPLYLNILMKPSQFTIIRKVLVFLRSLFLYQKFSNLTTAEISTMIAKRLEMDVSLEPLVLCPSTLYVDISLKSRDCAILLVMRLSQYIADLQRFYRTREGCAISPENVSK